MRNPYDHLRSEHGCHADCPACVWAALNRAWEAIGAARAQDDPDACGYCGASAADHHLCAGYAADLAYEHERLGLLGTPGCSEDCPQCRSPKKQE